MNLDSIAKVSEEVHAYSAGVIDRIAMAMDKPSVATTVVRKDTEPAIARRIDHHREEESFEDPGQTRLEDIKAETVEDDFDDAPRVGSDLRVGWVGR